MEKVYLKPSFREIITKNPPGTGHADIFSYSPDSSDESSKLGSLFVVGHVQHESDDVAYMINLIAALAKREYYSKPALMPKDAFSNTLKKINDVVQDFFKNNELALNIGVFVIAGDNIHIAKLGKFKIFLAREERNVDILNNVDLFEKEHIQEREFSSIISGKLLSNDKLLALYPNQPVVSREKNIRMSFAKLTEADFIRKVNSLKTENEGFACALLYINLKKVRETALAPKIQPRELEVSLAKTERVYPEAVRLPSSQPSPSEVSVHPIMNSPLVAPQAITVTGTQPIVQPVPAITPQVVNFQAEPPRIIASEFSLGKRMNIFSALLNKIRLPKLDKRAKWIISSASLVSVAIVALLMKSVFLPSAGEQQARDMIKTAQNNIQIAKDKIAQNDAIGARGVLLGSIGSISSLPSNKTDQINDLNSQLNQILDSIDLVKDVPPQLVGTIDGNLSKISMLTATENGYFAYACDQAGDNCALYSGDGQNISELSKITGIKSSMLFTGDSTPVLLDPVSKTIAYLKDGQPKSSPLTFDGAVVSADLYQDNLYILSPNSIFKASDVVSGPGKVSGWLTGSALSAGSKKIVVDGNIFVLSDDGLITVFYKGSKSTELKTSLRPNEDSLLLTTADSSSLYVVEKSIGRIYLIDKKSGDLTATYKSGSSIAGAAVSIDGAIYFSSGDNKVWKLK